MRELNLNEIKEVNGGTKGDESAKPESYRDFIDRAISSFGGSYRFRFVPISRH